MINLMYPVVQIQNLSVYVSHPHTPEAYIGRECPAAVFIVSYL